jgi:hypothetical protein
MPLTFFMCCVRQGLNSVGNHAVSYGLCLLFFLNFNKWKY